MNRRIAITGASGFVGTLLAQHLRAAGHEVVPLVRAADGERRGVRWDPQTGALGGGPGGELGHVHAVVHLAGENIASGRWSAEKKRRIADSRGPVTERLCRTLAALPERPDVLVSASATGIHGDRGDEPLDDASTPGTGFLADVAVAWERGTAPAADAGIRVVPMRFGMVLDRDGGALAKMLTPFRLGAGAVLGPGTQWVPWITRHDLVRAIRFVLDDASLHGPVLACAPAPVTNRTFTRALAGALHRPALLRVPAFALRLLFGEMADAVLLASQRAGAQRLPRAGFGFDHPDLDTALRHVLARAPADPAAR